MKWIKYDLHMHSNASRSKDHNVRKMDPKDFVNTLLEKGIEVFSITDHNTFDGTYYDELYQCIIEPYDSKIRLIPGAELDVDIPLKNGDKHYLNILFYFEKKYDNLGTVIEGLYRNSNPDLMQIIDTFNENRYKYIIIPEGTGNRGIEDYIKKMEPEAARYFNIQGIYKIFGGFDKTVKDNFNAKVWALGFYQQSKELNDIVEKIEGSKEEFLSRIWDSLNKGETLDSDIENDFAHAIKQYSSFLARFKFSDWHNKDEYNFDYYNHIFGDFEKPFESFELALIDPESRLIVSKNRTIEDNQAYIKQLNFKIDKQMKNITFTEGLNVIIGDRGSGKSLLHSIIRALKEGPETYSDYSKHYSIKDVEAALVNNQLVTPTENYNSIEVINQKNIEKYFEKQPSLLNYLQENFKELEEVDLSDLENILSSLENITIDVKVDDNISPILSNIKRTQGFIINSNLKLKDYSEVAKYNLNISKSIETFIRLLEQLGYITKEIKKRGQDFEKLASIYVENANSIETFKKQTKSLISKFVNKSQEELNRAQNAYTLLEDYAKRAEKYLISHYNNQKSLYLLENLKIRIPSATYNYHELGYIFRNSSKVKEEEMIRDEVKQEILGTIYRGNFNDFEQELYRVVKGENRFNKDKNPSLSVRKYISNLDVSNDLHLYKVSKGLDLSQVQLNDDVIADLIKKNNIESVTEGSLGMKTAAYLDFAFDSKNDILLFDQPEDNIDNRYIASRLADIIKKKKKKKQLIFVTHNPSIAVYADAFNYIMAVNNEDGINYDIFEITSLTAKKEILAILDGGKFSFANRNNKYGNIVGGIDYED